jgi:hypothetical protein
LRNWADFGSLPVVTLPAQLRQFDDRLMGGPPAGRAARAAATPYVLAGLLCAGLPAGAVLLAGGSLLVALLLPLLGLIPLGIVLLLRS